MYERFLKYWDGFRTSLWFLPTVLVIAAIVLSQLAIAADRSGLGEGLARAGWVYVTGAAGARAVLSTIAASMITVAGVVFSITMVVLSLASSQFGSRLIRSFMYHRITKLVLGTFTSTFVFCLFALCAVHDTGEVVLIPRLTTSVGLLLALISLGLLIYFIHHVASSIQAPHVIAAVGAELDEVIDRAYPRLEVDSSGQAAPLQPPGSPVEFDRPSQVVASPFQGYVQAVDADGLVASARAHRVVVELLRRPGDPVAGGSDLARVWAADAVSDELARAVAGAYVVGRVRTPLQDPLYALDQLVEIAVRALSPGINDPFTAMECVHRIGTGLRRLVGRRVRSPYCFDDDGGLRVIARTVGFAELIDRAFDPIRGHAGPNRGVRVALLEMIENIAPLARGAEVCAALRRQADMIRQGAADVFSEEHDRRVVEERCESALRALDRECEPTTRETKGQES